MTHNQIEWHKANIAEQTLEETKRANREKEAQARRELGPSYISAISGAFGNVGKLFSAHRGTKRTGKSARTNGK